MSTIHTKLPLYQDDLGFIILRNVNNKLTDNYWKESYTNIRKFYPDNKIVIIDDNSNYDFIIDTSFELINTVIIDSEYKKRGELLPYIYYLKHKFFKYACFIHDSIFINEILDLSLNDNFTYKPLFNFTSNVALNHKKPKQLELLSLLDNYTIVKHMCKENKFNGIFGVMSVISLKYLEYIDKKHNLNNLIPKIISRIDREMIERIFGCIFAYHNNKFITNTNTNKLHDNSNNNINNSIDYGKNEPPLYGGIHQYLNNHCIGWGYRYEDYLNRNDPNYKSKFIKTNKKKPTKRRRIKKTYELVKINGRLFKMPIIKLDENKNNNSTNFNNLPIYKVWTGR
jgi:hypothetical protein